MSTNSGLASFERELTCSICTEILYQPLTILDCLHSFCGSCLKEWFQHQYRRALSSRTTSSNTNPYSCPTCRAAVRDTQRNATVNNLLDLFLAANPSKGKDEESKKEMRDLYTPGENIVPKLERRRRHRHADETTRLQEQRMIEEAQQRSLRDLEVSGPQELERRIPSWQQGSGPMNVVSARQRDRSVSRERLERRQRRRERERQRNEQGAHSLVTQSAEIPISSSVQRPSSPPVSSPRHPSAVENRQREQRMMHQASLRSLMSASESGTGTGDSLDEARIMQEILAEGLLGDVNIDDLSERDQEELAERIARAYHERHRREASTAILAQTFPLSPVIQAMSNQRISHRPRSRTPERPSTTSSMAHSSAFQTTTTAAQNAGRPSTSLLTPIHFRPRRVSTGESSPGTTTNTIRPSRMRTSSSTTPEMNITTTFNPNRPVPQRRSSGPPASVSTPLPESRRANHSHPHIEHSPARSTRSLQPAQLRTDLPNHITDSTHRSRTPLAELETAPAPSPPTGVPRIFREPQISCERCHKSDIQYDLHKDCPHCQISLCLSCYREGRGCYSWYGFGHAAEQNFALSRQTEDEHDFPHHLISQRFDRPDPAEVVDDAETGEIYSTTTPEARLHQGYACDRCSSFCMDWIWQCETCNYGDWYFCDLCVQTHHGCTHALLPLVRLSSTQTQLPGFARNQRPWSSYAGPGHVSTTPACASCHKSIMPDTSFYHCPGHTTAENRDMTNMDPYNLCQICYHNMVKSGSITRDNGPAGWRRCPSGHRMLTVALESMDKTQFRGRNPTGYGLPKFRRALKNNLVGGCKMTEDDIGAWNEQHHMAPNATVSYAAQQSSPLQSHTVRRSGTWTWQDDLTTGRRVIRTRTNTLDLAQQTQTRFPPDGGTGGRGTVIHAYYPEEGEAGAGELVLPKSAEVLEIEDVNGDWLSGVYAGDIGLFPRGYVREHARV